jgi:AraC-like DNA-binding protein
MAQWRMSNQIKTAFSEGLAVVHRKHKRRQEIIGPVTARVDELFLAVDGNLQLMSGGRWRAMPPRALACIRRGEYYGIRQQPGCDGPAQIVNVLFCAPPEWTSGLPRHPVLLSAPWWRRFMELESNCEFDATGQRVLCKTDVLAYVERLARAAAFKPAAGRRPATALPEGPRRPDTGAEWMELWARAVDVIRQQAGAGLTAGELADAVHVSPTQLRRVFHSAQGISPKAALLQWRVEQAAKLLESGKWNATQTAEMTGFATLQHFSAVFKAGTGKSPREFLRKL